MSITYEIFAKDGLSNIFDGALIPQTNKFKGEIDHKRVIGYRLESVNHEKVKVICNQPEDENGVYSATVHLDGVRRKGRKNTSTFFPKYWKKTDVIQAIIEAYESKILRNIEINQYIGKTQNGINVILWLDNNQKVIDAMPLRGHLKAIKEKRKSKRLCRECGNNKHLICFDHHPSRKPLYIRIPKKIRYYFRKFYFGLARKAGLVN